MNDRERMAQAAQWIRDGKYAAARELLIEVRAPEYQDRAQGWIVRIDSLAAPAKPASPAPPAAKPSRSTRIRKRVSLVIVFVLVGMLAVVGVAMIRDGQRATIKSHTYEYCRDLQFEVGLSYDFAACWQWAETQLTGHNASAVFACHNRYPDLSSLFQQCLWDEGLTPPGVMRR